MSTNVRSYNDRELIDRVTTHARGFEGWRRGVYDIWVRSSEDQMDAFDDKVYTFSVAEDHAMPEFRMLCTGTTNAGSYGLKRFRDYNPLGCAVLEADRIVYGSHIYGHHKNYRAYRQAKGWPYYRDNDRDDKAEEIGRVYNDIIFANCHRAAAVGESTRIYNWSVACLVRNKANQWFAWLAYMDKRPLNGCILKEF
jgi:hypothetical protein